MKENIPGIVRIVPFFDAGFRVRYEGKVVRATIVGAERDIFFIKDIDTFRGRLFDNGEEMERNAVIGYKVYTNLFSSDPIGKYILIYRIPTKVIGVLEEKGVDYTGQDLDLQIFIPLEAFMRKYRNVDYVRGAYIQIEDGRDLKEMKETIAHFLRKIHGLKESEKDDFTIFTMDDILRTKEQGIKLVSTLTIISSLVSFAVGGLGIFAIMLLTVAERKVEIGIRRAVGSKKKDIILQFLTESAIIAATGGIAGLVAGLIITLIVDHIGKFPFAIKTSTLLFSFAITTLVGILAGVYPALQGRKYEPIEVLYQ
jgi:putative ABC transport system permease protein